MAYILDGEDDDHFMAMGDVIDAAGGQSTAALPRPQGAERYITSDITHRWNEALFDHIAINKDRLIQKAFEEGYDKLLFVDSDLILDPTTVHSLLRVQADLVSAVFWTTWNGNDDRSLGPNVWLRHPYDQAGLGMTGPEFWHRLAQRRVTRIAGGGAAIMLSRKALESGLRYYPRIPNLPDHGMYRGEDRSFAIRAKRLHLTQVCDPWPDIFHAYHPWQREPVALAEMLAELSAPRPLKPQIGDLVSFTLTPMEETVFGRHGPEPDVEPRNVRGRLGGLELLPEIEDTLLDMTPGEDRILNLKFPGYWPANTGQQRMVQIELIDAKPLCFAPSLVDHVCRGLEPPRVLV